MKNSRVCVKCKSNNVTAVHASQDGYNLIIRKDKIMDNYIEISRYICLDCGYMENWISHKGDLEKLSKKTLMYG